MSEAYKEKKITRLDVYFGGSLIIVLLVLAISILLHSIELVYIAILLVLGDLGYGTKGYESRSSFLRDLWILALLSLVLYPPIDYFFEAKLGLVTYLTNGLRIIATPIYILLYWVLGALLFGYFYCRIHGLTNEVWIGDTCHWLVQCRKRNFVRESFQCC